MKNLLLTFLFVTFLSNATVPTGDATQLFCDYTSPTIANVVVMGNNIIWFATNDSTGTPLPTTTVLINNETYYAFDSTDIAAGSLAVTVQVFVPAPYSECSDSFCNDELSTFNDLPIFNNNGYDSIYWFSTIDQLSGTQIDPSTLLVNGIYYAFQGLGVCALGVEVSIDIIEITPSPIMDSPYTICGDEIFANLPIENSAGYSEIYWFSSPYFEYPISPETIISTGTYYCSQGIGMCATLLTVDLIVSSGNAETPPTGSFTQYFISVDNPKVADLVINDYTPYSFNELEIFDHFESGLGNGLPHNTPLINGATYFVRKPTVNAGDCFYYLKIKVYLDYHTINGKVQFDFDNNGCDSTDDGLIDIPMISTNGTNTFYTRSRYDGYYTQNIFNSIGNVTTTLNLPTIFDVSPMPFITNVSQLNSPIVNQDFCVTANQIADDVAIEILPNTIRPGFNTTCKIVYSNHGTTLLDGDITFLFDDSKMTFIQATETLNSQTSNSVTFNYTGLNPFEKRSIIIFLQVFQPPTTVLGNVVNYTAIINPITTDINTDDNTFSMDRTVIDSYDPNDITCLEGDVILEENIDKYLHYVIRFQNEGSANAIKVRVENQLDSKLDWSSLQIIDSSHPNRIEMKNGLVNFIFSDINLPFTEPDSKGYIFYKIKPKSNVVLGDIFENQAHIFFDFNAAVDTNIAITEITSVASVKDNFTLDFSITPIPVTDTLTIHTIFDIQQVEIYSSLGQLLLLNNNQKQINVSSLSTGVYGSVQKSVSLIKHNHL